MTRRMRSEYEQACTHLTLLQESLGRMEEIGIAQPWSWALRADVSRLFRSMRAAMDAADREAGKSGAQADDLPGDLPGEDAEAPSRSASYFAPLHYPPSHYASCPSASRNGGGDRRLSFAQEAVITIHQDRKPTVDLSARSGRHHRP